MPANPKLPSEAAGKAFFADDLLRVENIKNGYSTQFLLHKVAVASLPACAPSLSPTVTPLL